MKKIIVLLCLLTVNFSFSQSNNQAEKVATKFLLALKEGDYEKAYSYCILEAQLELRPILRTVSRGVPMVLLKCASFQSEYGVTCQYDVVFDGRHELLFLDMTSVDKKWKIYNMRSGGRSEIEPELTKKSKRQRPPSETFEGFSKFIESKKYQKAELFVIMEARLNYIKMVNENPEKLPVGFNDISCNYDGNQSKIICTCMNVYRDGSTEEATYELTEIDGSWKIVDFYTALSPKQIVMRFVNGLAAGKCEDILRYAEGAATENIQGSIDAGCTSYNTEILSISCEEENDTTICSCVEKRDGMEMTFNYYLTNGIEGWKVYNYQKDLNLDLGTTGGETTTKTEVVKSKKSTVKSDWNYLSATYPGEYDELDGYLRDSIRYENITKEQRTNGTVIISFYVEEDGSITNIVIEKGINAEVDKEAIRLIQNMPKWIPANLDGVKYRSQVIFGVVFVFGD